MDPNEVFDLESQFSVKLRVGIPHKKNLSGSLTFSKSLRTNPELRLILCLEVCTVEDLIISVGVFKEIDLEPLAGSGELFLPKKHLYKNPEVFNPDKLLNSLFNETEF